MLNLVRLNTWLSPAFPVGAFSYSHGLEWLISENRIADEATLRDWLAGLLTVGSVWNDAVLFREAHAASSDDDAARLAAVAELAAALAPSRERHLETVAQGSAFVDAVATAWPTGSVRALKEIGGAAYPVAVGAIAADHRITADAALAVYLNAVIANLVSVAVRLVPLGQSAGLRVQADLHPLLTATAERAVASSLDDLGSATLLGDIAAMRHETQYSRVFRT